jgi:hypothetical protein
MTHGRFIPRKLAVIVVLLAGSALLTSAAVAQEAPPPGYPAQNQVYQAYPASAPAPAPAVASPQSHPLRNLFAGTIAAVLQTVTGGLVNGLNGSIMNWFAGKQAPGTTQGYGAAGSYGYSPATPNAGAVPGYPTAGTQAYPAGSYPGSSAQYPGATYPATAAYPGQAGANPGTTASAYDAGATQVYDARTGQLVTGGANPYATPTGGNDGTLYAGIAYEVHALSADGHSAPINPATYVFHTGDRFMVYYRPSMPGHMEIYNVNPAGQQTLIDATNMAAGQMTTLGPYQFTNLTGDESLRLVLSPCSSPQLLAATRDIVRADAAYAVAPQASGGAQLSACGTTTTRGLGVRTRDIQKVAVDGMTSYALDPVSQQELSSGQVIPREASIVFHHR